MSELNMEKKNSNEMQNATISGIEDSVGCNVNVMECKEKKGLSDNR
jgi:hypothetical protein